MAASKLYSIDVTVAEALNALTSVADRRGVSDFNDLPDELEIEVEATIDLDTISDAAINNGFIHEDDALDGIEPALIDLADGLRELMAGDRRMAATLLARAFSDWPDAARTVEDLLLSRTAHDRRQLSMLAVAA